VGLPVVEGQVNVRDSVERIQRSLDRLRSHPALERDELATVRVLLLAARVCLGRENVALLPEEIDMLAVSLRIWGAGDSENAAAAEPARSRGHLRLVVSR
jgi:hypothetical protein